MDQPSNPVATVSLVCGLLAMFGQVFVWCLSVVPFIGMFGIFLVPIVWLLSLVGLVTGIVGYRTANALDGTTGKGAAIGGFATSAIVLLIQVLLFVLAFVFGGLAFVLALLGGN